MPPAKKKDDDTIICIGTTTRNFGTGEEYRVVHGLGEYKSFSPEENVICYTYHTELALLEGWRDQIVKDDPDVLTGYNIDGFDWRYNFMTAPPSWIACEPRDSFGLEDSWD